MRNVNETNIRYSKAAKDQQVKQTQILKVFVFGQNTSSHLFAFNQRRIVSRESRDMFGFSVGSGNY